jgi:transcriptional regulator with GAF, ATPase, and Fis domain
VQDRLLSLGGHAIVDSVFLAGGDAEVAANARALRDDRTAPRIARRPLIVRDPAMTALMGIVAKVAPSPLSLLILGETGVGKDVVASLVHEISPRAAQRFVSVNCAGLPESLLESELFGHERGAFTGAVAPKPGLLEEANGGTVFLDEVGELPLNVQAKLLRAVESHEITRVGGLRPRPIDVRFVAATNRDLVAEVAAGCFRADLFYRLDGLSLTVPPLRERRSEILPLARHFVEAACQRFGAPRPELSARAAETLMAHGWPGNVRELRNAMARAVLLVSAPEMIEPVHLNLLRRSAPAQAAAPATSERERIIEALSACAGNQRRAAALLGMSRRTLVRRIAQLSLPRPRPAR